MFQVINGKFATPEEKEAYGTGLPEPKRYCCVTGAMGETFDPKDRTKPKGDYVRSSDYDALRAAYEKERREREEAIACLREARPMLEQVLEHIRKNLDGRYEMPLLARIDAFLKDKP